MNDPSQMARWPSLQSLTRYAVCLVCGFAWLMSGCAHEPVDRQPVNNNRHGDSSEARIADKKCSKLREWPLPCLGGETIYPFETSSTHAIVLVFVATDCPIANAYHPQLKELARKFGPQGIEFFLVHSNPEVSEEAAFEHVEAFGLDIPVVMDLDQAIARRVQAEVTPEAFVIRRDLEVPVYQGAIDNRYVGYGKKRPAATEHYLEDALEQCLSGSRIKVPKTKSIGCFLDFD